MYIKTKNIMVKKNAPPGPPSPRQELHLLYAYIRIGDQVGDRTRNLTDVLTTR